MQNKIKSLTNKCRTEQKRHENQELTKGTHKNQTQTHSLNNNATRRATTKDITKRKQEVKTKKQLQTFFLANTKRIKHQEQQTPKCVQHHSGQAKSQRASNISEGNQHHRSRQHLSGWQHHKGTIKRQNQNYRIKKTKKPNNNTKTPRQHQIGKTNQRQKSKANTTAKQKHKNKNKKTQRRT